MLFRSAARGKIGCYKDISVVLETAPSKAVRPSGDKAILPKTDPVEKKIISAMVANPGALASYALSEAGSGSDAFALTTRAVEDGDHYILNGRKLWITNAAEAHFFLVFATVNPDLGYKGVTAFLVERDTPGFAVGKKEDKLGIRASSTCELLLDNCRIAKANILGEVGKGYKVAIETLDRKSTRLNSSHT